jgi:glycosyltransferase involved in cell wall biosynthesis
MATRLTFIMSTLTIGGAQRHFAVLLPKLRDLGYDVRAITLIGEGPFFDDLRAADIEIDCAWLSRRTDLSGWRRVSRFIDRGTDLIVSQNVNGQFVAAVFAAQKRLPHVVIDQTGPGLRFRRYQNVLVRLAVRTVDAVVGVTPAQVDQLAAFGVPRNRIVIIPNGVDELEPQRSRQEVRAELGLADDDFGALLVADLRPEKRGPFFVEAVRRAHAQNPRVKGLVAGAGPELPLVQDLARGAERAITVLGARLDVPDLMHACDCVCLTSEAEALPMVALEAMSLGKPVVATRVGGLVSTVHEGETGLLVPPDDVSAFSEALLELAADPPRSAALGEAGREEHRRRFTSAGMAEAYADVFEHVLATNGSRGR